VVYVGKAINIRYRVNSHFSNDAPTLQKQRFIKTIHGISFQECATPLMATLLESAEIKHRWPRFNAAQKKWEDVFTLHIYEDQRGYLRLAIDKNRKNLPAVSRFHYLADGQASLRKLIREHELCMRLCFLQTTEGPCEGTTVGYCKGACVHEEPPHSYNERVINACQELRDQPSFAIIEKGRTGKEKSCILVEAGQFYGMGYIPKNLKAENLQELKSILTRYRENSFILRTIKEYADTYPEKVVHLKNEPHPIH
ncbi:MAG: DNA polymerase III subunit epsilon, partial [Chitinophagaceae bacterium]